MLLNSHPIFFCYTQLFHQLVYTVFSALCLIQTSSVKAAVSYSGGNSVRETLQTHFPKKTVESSIHANPRVPRGCRATGATCRPAGAAPLRSCILSPYLLDNTSFFWLVLFFPPPHHLCFFKIMVRVSFQACKPLGQPESTRSFLDKRLPFGGDGC